MIRRTRGERDERLKAELAERVGVAGQGPKVVELLARCDVAWKGRFRCQSPGCPACRKRNIAKQRRDMQDKLRGVDNSQMAFVTVVLPGVRDVREIEAAMKKGLTDLRNRICACRRASKRWDSLEIFGWYEIDTIAFDQMPYLADERRELLSAIAPTGCEDFGPVWVPTIHALVYLGDVEVADAQHALEQQWPLANQTDIRRFQTDQEFEINVNNLVGYVNKFACSTSLCAPVDGGKYVDQWPPAWEAELLEWLHAGHRNAFERLRFRIGQKRPRKTTAVVLENLDKRACASEPLPFVVSFSEGPFTEIPTYKYNYENNRFAFLFDPYPGPSRSPYYRSPP